MCTHTTTIITSRRKPCRIHSIPFASSPIRLHTQASPQIHQLSTTIITTALTPILDITITMHRELYHRLVNLQLQS